jgi:hypothetical protein
MADLPGKDLARELIDKSRAESRSTPVEAVIAAAREADFDDDKVHRLLGRLWTLERMFYYIYGGWGQGLEINDFPPSVKYLFSKQIVDESAHEMLYLDAQLKNGFVTTQKDAFRHPYGRFSVDSGLAYYVFSLRNLATYPHSIRIAAQPRAQDPRARMDGGARRSACRFKVEGCVREPSRRKSQPREYGPARRRGVRPKTRRRGALPLGVRRRQTRL